MLKVLGGKEVKIFIAILAIFAVGLVGFYIFSAQYGDGLEVTMENAGVEEAEPVYTGPLSYGGSFFESLAMGIIGFFITLAICLLFLKLLRKKEDRQS